MSDAGGEPRASPEPPAGEAHREVRDPRALRAMAHPVRLRLLAELADLGQATATDLAGRIGESPANCSWHLRQLARYGLIEEAPGGTGRQRPWRLVAQQIDGSDSAERTDPSEWARAGDLLGEVMLGQEAAALREWFEGRDAEPTAWRSAGFATYSWGILTADELAQARSEIQRVLERWTVHLRDRLDPARRPPGARLVRLVAWGVPHAFRSDRTAAPPGRSDRTVPAEDHDHAATPADPREEPTDDHP